MLNFGVEGLDDMNAALEAKEIEVITNPEWDAPGRGPIRPNPRPEGNQIELWEPD